MASPTMPKPTGGNRPKPNPRPQGQSSGSQSSGFRPMQSERLGPTKNAAMKAGAPVVDQDLKQGLKSDVGAERSQARKDLTKRVEGAKGGAAGKVAAARQGGTKEAAVEAGRQAAVKGFEKGAQYAADAATGGAAEAVRPVIKAAAKALEWVSRNKRWLKIGAVLISPLIFVFLLIIWIISDPFGSISKIGYTAFNAFKTAAGAAISGAGFSAELTINDLNEQMKSVAATNSAGIMPEEGTIAYKLLQIDAEKIQTSSYNPGIPFKIETKKINGPDGRSYTVMDKVVNTNSGSSISIKDAASPTGPIGQKNIVAAVLSQKIPIMQFMIRQPATRKLNKAPDLGLALNYGENKDNQNANLNRPYEELQKFLKEKTYKRVRGSSITLPTVGVVGSDESKLVTKKIVDSIKKVQDDIVKDYEPSKLQIELPYDQFGQERLSPKRISNTLCAFQEILLDPKNIASAVESRANAARRDGAKFMTLKDTHNKAALDANELKFSIQQMADYTKSMSYQRIVYGRLSGEAVDPDGIGQAAMSITREKYDASAQTILQNMSDACGTLRYLDQRRADEAADASVWSDESPNNFIRTYYREIRAANVTVQDIQSYYVEYRDSPTCDPLRPNSDSSDKVRCAVYSFRIAILRNYFNKFQQEIYRGSQKYYTSPEKVTPEDITTRLIKIGAGVSTTGLEDGNQNFSRAIQGLNQLNYDYSMVYGGRFLTDAENDQNAKELAELRDWQTKNYGIAYRVFNTDNVSSIASRLMQHTPPEPKRAIAWMFGSILKAIINPIRTFATIDGAANYVLKGEQNIAMAADQAVYNDARYNKASPVGFTKQETSIDWKNNAKFIEALKKNKTQVVDPDPLVNGAKVDANTLFSKWDNCFTSKITSEIYFDDNYLAALNFGANLPEIPQQERDELKRKYELFSGCKPLLSSASNNINSLQVQYRVYRFRSLVLDSLVTLSNDEEDKNLDANGDQGATPSTSAGPGGPSGVNGLQSPPNLGAADSQGYYRLPPSAGGSYRTYSTPGEQCGSLALIQTLYTVSQAWKARFGGYLYIGDLNASGHKSHRNGVDVDLIAIAGDGSRAADYSRGGYSRDKTIELGKMFVDTGIVTDIGYQDGQAGSAIDAYYREKGQGSSVVRPWSGHDDHFHVRIKDEFRGPRSERCAN